MKKTLFLIAAFMGMAFFSMQAEDSAEISSWKKEESFRSPCQYYKRDQQLAKAGSLSDALNKFVKKHKNDFAKCGRKPCHCHA